MTPRQVPAKRSLALWWEESTDERTPVVPLAVSTAPMSEPPIVRKTRSQDERTPRNRMGMTEDACKA